MFGRPRLPGPVLTVLRSETGTLNGVPEFFEVDLAESLISRTETLGTCAARAHASCGAPRAEHVELRDQS